MIKNNIKFIAIIAVGIVAAVSASLVDKAAVTDSTATSTTPVVATSTTPTATSTATTTPVTQGKCYVGGCSGQICADTEGMVSTCEYREVYGCYRTATCERQSTGKCGWTETAELSQCIQNTNQASTEVVY